MTLPPMVGDASIFSPKRMEPPFDKNLLIACRVRPLNDTEKQRKDQDVVNIPEEGAAVWVGLNLYAMIKLNQ